MKTLHANKKHFPGLLLPGDQALAPPPERFRAGPSGLTPALSSPALSLGTLLSLCARNTFLNRSRKSREFLFFQGTKWNSPHRCPHLCAGPLMRGHPPFHLPLGGCCLSQLKPSSLGSEIRAHTFFPGKEREGLQGGGGTVLGREWWVGGLGDSEASLYKNLFFRISEIPESEI